MLLSGYAGIIRHVPAPPPSSARPVRTMNLARIAEPLTGKSFGRLVVLSFAGACASGSSWRCRCACGAEKVIARVHLVTGRVRSCGCLRRDMCTALNRLTPLRRAEQR